MPKIKCAIPFLALAVALVSSGCMESQQSAANEKCGKSYVGRQKAACEMGVDVAAQTAKKDDGKSRQKKYQFAVGKCHKIEQPLVAFCVAGVDKFRAELAKLDPEQPRTVAKSQTARHRTVAQKTDMAAGRSPASSSVATAVPANSN